MTRMNGRVNGFARRLREGVQQIGMFATSSGPAQLEGFAECGFDWIVIDAEHGSFELGGVVDALRALDRRHTQAVVRPAANDQVLIKRLLDAGARTLLIPSVDTAEQARQAVAATRYPPEGIRGVTGQSRAARYGHDTSYLSEAAGGLCVIVQAESVSALAELRAIATTPGVDAVFVGPSDLAASMGHLGDTAHPLVQAAVDDALSTLAELGVPRGYLAMRADEARQRIADGVDFLAIATDTSIVARGVKALEAEIGRAVTTSGRGRDD